METLEPELVIANAVQEIEEEIAQEETHAGQMEEFAKTEFSGEMRSPEKTEGFGETENPGKTGDPGKIEKPENHDCRR